MQELIDGDFFLEKFPGKGGWTFIRLPLSGLGSKNYFGMFKVSGKIDSHTFESKNLMPYGDGTLFLPVSKEIRKKILKESGSKVHLQLFRNEFPNQVPDELRSCLLDYPGKLAIFLALPIPEQKLWLEAIYSAQTEEKKAEQIVRLLGVLDKRA
jgi:hypothetical protein